MEKMPEVIHDSWYRHLQPLFSDPKMKMIKEEVLPRCYKYYPNPEDIFRVFEMPMDEIRVVILGQDPYPNGEAVGLAFAVDEMTTTPASLNVIRNEVLNSKAGDEQMPPSLWKTLIHWRTQGVFLLNTALTVEAKQAKSHSGYWQWFTKQVVEIISRYNEVKPVWLMWGSKAKGLVGYMGHSYILKPEDIGTIQLEDGINYVLQADHPAAELYPGSKYKFSGCNHFNLCNRILQQKGLEKIKW